MDSGNSQTPSMHRRLDSATVSQLAFPRESIPEFPTGEIAVRQYSCERIHWRGVQLLTEAGWRFFPVLPSQHLGRLFSTGLALMCIACAKITVHIDPSWAMSACASVRCLTTPTSQKTLWKWVVLYQCPISFVFLCRSLPNCVCMQTVCYVRKTVLLWKQTSCHLWKGDFECINLTIKFQYWSCGDTQRNWKNLVVVPKELKIPCPPIDVRKF